MFHRCISKSHHRLSIFHKYYNRYLYSTTSTTTSATNKSKTQYSFLSELGLSDYNHGVCDGNGWFGNGPVIESINPSNKEIIASIKTGNGNDYEQCLESMNKFKKQWSETPAPKRGDVIRTMSNLLRDKKQYLGQLIAIENGKILQEGLGEVQEAIDICDYAVGLSRNLNGTIFPSERFEHIMFECWNPLINHVGIITAFNFPCAVAFWNSAISLICGNTQIWKGASTVPLTTIACSKIIQQALNMHGFSGAIATTINGSGKEVGNKFAPDKRLDLISFTGSTEVGREVHKIVSQRFGKTIMELGGNNGAIIMNDADIEMAVKSVLFSAVGTAGQRCTSLRRLFLHSDIYDDFLEKLLNEYKHNIVIGDPLNPKTLCGPLINEQSVKDYELGIKEIKQSNKSNIIIGGNSLMNKMDGYFVEPTIVETEWNESFVSKELFAPVLYVIKFYNLDEVIYMHNKGSVHGLSSCLFTKLNSNIFKWLGPNGSDCGIVNVNIGTSGAEIGGAFGGEKDTGIGRESGSDSWKQYCRRSTCTVNYSSDLPLAQGIQFGGSNNKKK